jgi:serine/threonine protein kinase
MSRHVIQLSNFAIEVDNRGFLAGTVFEGALGFVVKIAVNVDQPRALKIPRLLADTDRDNDYVCSITENEVRTGAVLANGSQALALLDNGAKSLLCGIAGDGLLDAVIVQFSKELKPRFCFVSADTVSQKLTFSPNLDELKPWLTFEVWKQAIAVARSGEKQLTNTVVLRFRPGHAESTNPEIVSLRQQQAGRDTGGSPEESWFLGLPSPVYFWHEGTLEYAVRKGTRGSWGWRKHGLLCQQLARGLASLYRRGFVHGDLRPANVMYVSQPDQPNDYSLIDYASFSMLTGAMRNPSPSTDGSNKTLLGADINEARQSPFYPVERRVGRERENCDTVVIRRLDDKWNVHVGYRLDMFESETDQLTEDTQKQMKEAMTSSQLSSSAEWKRGDRIRIRDFVFQLEGWQIGPAGFSLASKHAWLVNNNRILVPLPAESFDNKDRVLSVSRTFPIWQWSMATDFFSLGVTLLYSLYFGRSSERTATAKAINLDNEFEALIAVMSTVQYAGVILPNLAATAGLLETVWKDRKFGSFTRDRIAALRLIDESSGVKWDLSGTKTATLEDNQCLLGRTWAVAMSVVQTTPGAHRILRAVDRNLAIFVCLVNLAMQLMHRRENLLEACDGQMPAGLMRWICDDRTVAPQPDKVDQLIDYITDIDAGLLQRFENATNFECPEEKILDYSSRNETSLRIEVRKKDSRIESLDQENSDLRSRIRSQDLTMKRAKSILSGSPSVMGRVWYKAADIESVIEQLPKAGAVDELSEGQLQQTTAKPSDQ